MDRISAAHHLHSGERVPKYEGLVLRVRLAGRVDQLQT